MLDVTPDDIARLDEEKLRALIGLLCEAELRRQDISTLYVRWGGNQNAGDGGIDVRVALEDCAFDPGFIPRLVTGFQAKKQDMPSKAIAEEMRPSGILRPTIAELARQSGAYVIVSSKGSVSESSLERRLKAMRDAVADCSEASKLLLDFYDRTRMSSWVREHAGLIVWVRNAIGRPIRGDLYTSVTH